MNLKNERCVFQAQFGHTRRAVSFLTENNMEQIRN